jgi:hypothetical protein
MATFRVRHIGRLVSERDGALALELEVNRRTAVPRRLRASASGDRHGQLREVRGDGVDGSQRCAASGACTPGVAYGAECRLIGLGSGATFVFALPERSVVDKADNARDSNALHDI